jgi:hypothetical protein
MLKGEELFEKYASKWGEYAQTLFTARMVVADDEKFFKALEKAEKEGKKIALVEHPEGIFGEPYDIEIV